MKKTKDSWFFFALYGITYLMLVLNSASLLADDLQLGELWQIAVFSIALLLCTGILFFCLRAFGLRLAIRRARKRIYQKKTSFFLTELLPALLLYVVSVCSRIWYAYQTAPGSGTSVPQIVQNSDFCKNPNGVLWLYGRMREGLVWLLGNDRISVFVLNAILQILLIVAGYLVLRTIIHRNAGIAYAVLWNIYPGAYGMLHTEAPELLYMLVVLILLGILVPVCRKCNGQEKRSVLGNVGLILTGILTGAVFMGSVLYLLVGITGFFLLAVYSRRKKTDLLCYGIGYAVGILAAVLTGTMLFTENMDMDGIVQGLKSYLTAYGQSMLLSGKIRISGLWLPEFLCTDVYLYYKIAICVLSGGVLFLFYKNERECGRIFGLLYAGSIIYSLSGYQALYQPDAPVMEMALLMTAVSAGMVSTMRNPLERAVPAETEDKDESAAKVEIMQVKLIENPLPLPKKHARKELDYAYEVKTEDMKYDVPVSDSDDFDLS